LLLRYAFAVGKAGCARVFFELMASLATDLYWHVVNARRKKKAALQDKQYDPYEGEVIPD
jgi:hypothetical protein